METFFALGSQHKLRFQLKMATDGRPNRGCDWGGLFIVRAWTPIWTASKANVSPPLRVRLVNRDAAVTQPFLDGLSTVRDVFSLVEKVHAKSTNGRTFCTF